MTEARNSIEHFQQSKSPAELKNAISALDRASSIFASSRPEMSRELGRSIADAWLNILITIDHNWDHSFDDDQPSTPNNTVYLNLVPPGGGYPSGIDPKEVKEPGIRKKYEAMIAENERRLERLNFQRELEQAYMGICNGSLSFIFLPRAYPFTDEKRKSEWVKLVNDSTLSKAKKRELCALQVFPEN
jgi:hypothetical protein